MGSPKLPCEYTEDDDKPWRLEGTLFSKNSNKNLLLTVTEHTYVYIYTYTCIYIYLNKYIHIYIYTFQLVLSFFLLLEKYVFPKERPLFWRNGIPVDFHIIPNMILQRRHCPTRWRDLFYNGVFSARKTCLYTNNWKLCLLEQRRKKVPHGNCGYISFFKYIYIYL